MDPTLTRILILLGVTTAITAGMLIAYSWARTQRAAFDDFRRAAYLSALGDIATRAGYPPQLVRGWARDRIFRQTLVEYLTFLTGTERENLLKAAQELDIIDHYVSALAKARTRRARVAAAEALGDLADGTAVGVLLGGLRDRIPEVRVQSAHALAAIGDPLTVGALLDALAEERELWVAERLADALIAFDKAAVLDASLRLEYMRWEGPAPPLWAPLVTKALGTIGDVRAQPALVRTLGAPSVELRALAAEGLGTAGTPDAVPILIGVLQDESPTVRVAAAQALGRQLDPRSLEPLLRALDDANRQVRRAAVSAIGSLPEGPEVLIEALSTADDRALEAIQDHLLASGMYRRAIVKLRSGTSTDRDHTIIDSLMTSGRLEPIETPLLDEVAR